MSSSSTLNNPAKLTELILDLERGIGKNARLVKGSKWNIVVTPSSDSIELINLFVVPTRAVPDAVLHIREERDRWTNDIIDEIRVYSNVALEDEERSSPRLDFEDVTLVTLIIPGTRPDRVHRFSYRRVRIRFLSALEHLWADRLRIDNIHERTDVLKALSATWSEKDETQFVQPAIGNIKENELSRTAAERLAHTDPSILDNGLAVIYGPGGIGKTHFMRRLAWRYTRRCLKDFSCGIPVFAILPTLLHQDALENFLAKQRGFSNLSLEQLRVLIRHQIIIPFLDAFDELVRGAVREGCKEFLTRVGQLMSSGGAGVLTSRDYFLNVDPLIPSSLSRFDVAELGLGFFNRLGRRSFIHRKTGLDDGIVAKWSRSLEDQVETLFGASPYREREVDSLIGHPLFMEALCNYIGKIPRDEVSKAAEEFKFRTPSIFGEIVTRVLEREREKARFGWQAKFGEKFVDTWRFGPFSTEQQLHIFTYLSCRVAQHGSEETRRRYGKDWIHGLYEYHARDETAGLDLHSLAGRKEALQRILRNVVGEPQFAASVTEEEAIELRKQAEAEIREFYLQHTLSETDPGVPEGLVFATRNKAYFEYFLAQELVNKIYEALGSNDAAKVIEWSEHYNVFDDYQDCLQFMLWDHRIGKEGYERLVDLVTGEIPADDTIASYCISLGLALALQRNATRNHSLSLRDLSLAPNLRWRLELLAELLPVISRIDLDTMSFPHLTIRDAELRNIDLEDGDFQGLTLSNCRLYEVSLRNVSCASLQLSGTITFHNCTLQLSDIDDLTIKTGASVHLTNCKLSQTLARLIESQPPELRSHVSRSRCQEIPDEDPDVELEGLSKGSRFLHRLMNLLRKHGRSTWGVYFSKLRGRTGLGVQFNNVIRVLADLKVIEVEGETVTLRPEASRYMFDGKRRAGRPTIDDYSAYWAPVVSKIDMILG